MYCVGVDLGATNVRAAVGDGSAKIVGSARSATPDGTTGERITQRVRHVVREACVDAGVEPTSVSAAGIGSMGRLDYDAGVVSVPSNLTEDIGPIPLVSSLSELLDTQRVSLCSDTLAGAIGERFFARPDVGDLVYLTISSGIGAGVISDGTPVMGRDGNAGEVGHTTVDARGEMTCGCGRDGHWEAYCSGNNIPRFATELHEDGVETALPLADEEFTAKDVFDHAGTDAFADRVIERVTTLNVLGVANVVHAYEPSLVSIGGAVALNNPEKVVEPIRERLDAHLVVEAPEVALCEVGEQAVLKGALAYALNTTDTP
jgi:glucokinase